MCGILKLRDKITLVIHITFYICQDTFIFSVSCRLPNGHVAQKRAFSLGHVPQDQGLVLSRFRTDHQKSVDLGGKAGTNGGWTPRPWAPWPLHRITPWGLRWGHSEERRNWGIPLIAQPRRESLWRQAHQRLVEGSPGVAHWGTHSKLVTLMWFLLVKGPIGGFYLEQGMLRYLLLVCAREAYSGNFCVAQTNYVKEMI